MLDYLIADTSETEQRRDIRSSWILGKIDKSQSTETVTSNVITIDGLCDLYDISKVDVMKIDVDGYDFKALLGASKIIERDKPIIIIELAQWALEECGASVTDVLGYFSKIDYSGYNANGMTAITSADVTRMTSGDKNFWMNGVFLPPN